MKVLVTGGAGFIGSHVVRRLLRDDHEVRVLDSLEPQVHGHTPPQVPDGVEFLRGDASDPAMVTQAVDGIDRILHLAAAVGVGQSMYEPALYVQRNTHATAVLLAEAVQAGVQKVVTASSMSIYGEGSYQDTEGRLVEATRRPGDVAEGRWDPTDAEGRPLTPAPTPESKRPDLASVYALTKYDQERLTLMMGQAYGVPSMALRFFNTYGPGQALQNPYTGVMAIFAARLLNGQPPMIYEDGHQLRDFVHVDDVARACCMALESPADGAVVNIGTGEPRSVLDVAAALAEALDADCAPDVLGKARTGDIRHCFADTVQAKELLGFEASTRFSDGVADLVAWLVDQRPEDRAVLAARELESRGLVR